MNNCEIGKQKEILAGKLLEQAGYRVIQFNYRCKRGEIDIVAMEEEQVVFVEVKYRKDDAMGEPQEAVDWRKQQKIIFTAQYYLLEHQEMRQYDCRFDVVAIKGKQYKIIKDAFSI